MSYNFKKIADLEFLNEKPDGASVVIETKGAVKRLQADKVGVTSWNELKDRPFYEETTTVGGDTLTWDGNTEGLVVAIGNGGNAYLVSKAVPTLEDCANGGSTSQWGDDGTEKVTDLKQAHFMPADDGVIILGLTFISVADNAAGKKSEAIGYTFPEPGVYALNAGMKQSITIHGYTGFVTTETVVKTIDPKYLPDSVKGGVLNVRVLNDGTSSVPYNEVYAAYEAGKMIYLRPNVEDSIPLSYINDNKFVWVQYEINRYRNVDVSIYNLNPDDEHIYHTRVLGQLGMEQES